MLLKTLLIPIKDWRNFFNFGIFCVFERLIMLCGALKFIVEKSNHHNFVVAKRWPA